MWLKWAKRDFDGAGSFICECAVIVDHQFNTEHSNNDIYFDKSVDESRHLS